MSDTWWVGKSDLDDRQKEVITLPLGGSYLVVGPPGSGKTNLLLLRANFMYLAGHQNVQVIAFTRSLQEFIASGGRNYDFPVSKVVTCRKWQQDLLREHGVEFDPPADFEQQRRYFITKLQEVIEAKSLRNLYHAIMLDESQDYVPDEIRIFKRLAKVLFCVADSRQKIYTGEDSIATLESLVDEKRCLKYHYRNGLAICRVADAIAKTHNDYEPLADTSNYDEESNPSSVDHRRCGSLDEQIAIIIERLGVQLKAYPGELFGVVCPARDEVMQIWRGIASSPLAPRAMLQLGRDRESFDPTKQICVCTFHAIKGLEVRGLHMAGCELLKKFAHNRNMAFTAITRAKTSVSLYYSDDIHGYLEAALKSLEPLPDIPKLDDVFGKGH